MNPELSPILEEHPQTDPFWSHLDYETIIPHGNSAVTGPELVALVRERYGDDMNLYDAATFPFLIHLAHYINELNRQQWRRDLKPLVTPSNVTIQAKDQETGASYIRSIDLTPWMEEMASYTPAQREVRMYTNGEYKKNTHTLLATLFQSVDSSSLFAKSFSFNSLFHCVRDDTSNTIHKYKNITDRSLRSSIAVVLPNGMVKVIQRRDDQPQKWNDMMQRLLPFADDDTFSLEELQKLPELNVQHVIDCSGESGRRKVPPYCLSPTAHSGFEVDLEKGEVVGSYDHAIADGTVMQSFYMQIMYDIENHHQSGLLHREEIQLPGQQNEKFSLLSLPHERKQAIGMLNMPDLPYTDLMMVLMQTRAADSKTGLRSVTGTATSNYPRPITGNRLHDHYAAMENRIGIFQEQYGRHKDYIAILNTIRSRLEEAYGKDNWMNLARTNYSDTVLRVIPIQMLQEFIRLRDRSTALTRDEIEASREDRNMSAKIIRMFHGKNMSWAATRLAQRLIRKKLLGNVNGTLLSQMTLDEGQTRPKGSPDYFFTTVTPDRNNAGLTKLKRAIITNREFYRKNMEVIMENLDLDRDPQTLSRSSHVLYVEDKNPKVAREKAIRLQRELYQNWILMSTLIDVAA